MGLASLFVLLLAVTTVPPAFADGGLVVASKVEGGMRVTAFTAPVPLRAGPADLSVLVQNARDGQTLLDASVRLRMVREEGGAAPVSAVADREQATNRLFYAARVNIPRAGVWRLQVRVQRGDEEVEVEAELLASEPLPPAARFWPWLSFPLVLIGVFLLHQWLRDRSRISRS